MPKFEEWSSYKTLAQSPVLIFFAKRLLTDESGSPFTVPISSFENLNPILEENIKKQIDNSELFASIYDHIGRLDIPHIPINQNEEGEHRLFTEFVTQRQKIPYLSAYTYHPPTRKHIYICVLERFQGYLKYVKYFGEIPPTFLFNLAEKLLLFVQDKNPPDENELKRLRNFMQPVAFRKSLYEENSFARIFDTAELVTYRAYTKYRRENDYWALLPSFAKRAIDQIRGPNPKNTAYEVDDADASEYNTDYATADWHWNDEFNNFIERKQSELWNPQNESLHYPNIEYPNRERNQNYPQNRTPKLEDRPANETGTRPKFDFSPVNAQLKRETYKKRQFEASYKRMITK